MWKSLLLFSFIIKTLNVDSFYNMKMIEIYHFMVIDNVRPYIIWVLLSETIYDLSGVGAALLVLFVAGSPKSESESFENDYNTN